jgi:hypothetical protein
MQEQKQKAIAAGNRAYKENGGNIESALNAAIEYYEAAVLLPQGSLTRRRPHEYRDAAISARNMQQKEDEDAQFMQIAGGM